MQGPCKQSEEEGRARYLKKIIQIELPVDVFSLHVWEIEVDSEDCETQKVDKLLSTISQLLLDLTII